MSRWLVLWLASASLAYAADPVPSTQGGGATMGECGTLVDSGLNRALSIRQPGVIPTFLPMLDPTAGRTNQLTIEYTLNGESFELEFNDSDGTCDLLAFQNPYRDNLRDSAVILYHRAFRIGVLFELAREIDSAGDEDTRTLTFPYTFEIRNNALGPLEDFRITWAAFPDSDMVVGETYVAAGVDDDRSVAMATYPTDNAALGVVNCSGGEVDFAAGLTADATSLPVDGMSPTTGALRWQSTVQDIPPATVVPLSFGLVVNAAALGSEPSVDEGVFAACDRDDDDDSDQDGLLENYRHGGDCDDSDPLVGAGELYWADMDGDGYGNPYEWEFLCEPEDGMVVADYGNDDCDDTNPLVYPGSTDVVGSGVDGNCDELYVCAADADGDGFGDANGATVNSLDPFCRGEGETLDRSDCDDTDPTVNPAATESVGNEIDEDCDGTVLCYVDADGDGAGSFVETASEDADCDDPGEALLDNDCDDTDPTVLPGAIEIPGNTIDEDCDGIITCYVDADDDGYAGNATVDSEDNDCTDDGENAMAQDCDDANADISPDADEIAGNDIDEDCDGFLVCYADLDGDGFGSMDQRVLSLANGCDDDGEADNDLDCDDTDPDVNPDATEVGGNSVDEDCDGVVTIDDPDVNYWAGGRSRCAVVDATPALGVLSLAFLLTLTRRRRANSEVR